jgi:hypothetical protein
VPLKRLPKRVAVSNVWLDEVVCPTGSMTGRDGWLCRSPGKVLSSLADG